MPNYLPMAGEEKVRLFLDQPLLDTIDEAVFKQAANTAHTCGVDHVCVLPDAHVGYGAPIGSVVVSADRVIPGPVGYDIGCFRGDTPIPTVDGAITPISELAARGEPVWVYAINGKHQVVVAHASAALTRQAAPLVEVTLDHGRTIVCTPDHEFMLRDGSFREAEALAPGTSLMPFYTRADRDGYRTVCHPSTGREQRVYWVLARQGLLGEIPEFEAQRTVSHHRNFHPWDNRPENLEFIGIHNHRRDKHGYNHRVTAVRPLEEVADVYCLTVPEFGNFALDAGVFVHNCGMALYPTVVPAEMLKDRLLRRKVMDAIDRGIAMGEGKASAHDVAVSHDMLADVLNRGAYALRDRQLVPASWPERCERPMHAMPDHPTRGAKPFHLSEVPEKAQRGFRQLGTLGGGNHFIELQAIKLADDPALRAIAEQWGLFDGQLAVMVHSGSRGFGHALGEWAFETFRARNDREGEPYADKELVHAPVTSPEARQYMRFVAAGANFALANRLLMARVVKNAVESVLPNAKLGLLYEISHNLAQWEPDEAGELKLVHRKGTTRAFPAHHPMLAGTMWAETGHPVITPGSMGTFSAIQVGLPGAAASFFSINHGAGRRLSRSAAKKTLDQGQVDAEMEALDILVNCRHTPLDEAPAVYKDLEEVLRAVRACDLAAAVARCYPIGSMKGADEPRGSHGADKWKNKKKG